MLESMEPNQLVGFLQLQGGRTSGGFLMGMPDWSMKAWRAFWQTMCQLDLAYVGNTASDLYQVVLKNGSN